ncbi:MAG: Hpt domain-containing protein [Gemmatimonadetes bacterium]|nr:Hpt domain-containing protein [Gemmatimonadota bacterium]
MGPLDRLRDTPTHAPPMTDPDVLEPSALDRLKEWGGEKLLGQMIRLFLENAPGRMAQIRAGAQGGDIKEAEKGAHSLKTSAATEGAPHVRSIAADMARAAAGGDKAAVLALLPSLESAFSRAIAALESVEKGLSS